MDDTFSRVQALMVKEFQVDAARIEPATELASIGVDSLAALEFMFALEEEFHIDADVKTDLRGRTVGDLVALVAAERAKARTTAQA
jgi:acyl carrier protein